MMEVHVKRVFSIQEERQAQYHTLRKVQLQYASKECSTEYYNQSMSRVTSTFQSLSQEVLKLTSIFREAGLPEVVKIMEDVQKREKEKLDLTVKWQILTQREKCAQDLRSGEGSQNGASEDGPCVDQEERERLKRRLAEVEGIIADLLLDFKFECEPILLSQSQT